MEEIENFIKAYLDEWKICIGQFPRRYWTIFPDFFYRPYIIRARKCVNGVAFRFFRPSEKESIKVEFVKKRAEEVFLPYLPHPPYYAVFAWRRARRVKIIGPSIINFDWSQDPEKGKKFQRLGEDFSRRSVMHLEGSNEVQMINCNLSGITDRGRFKDFIRFLWMLTGDCVVLTDYKARWYARSDFSFLLNHILFVWGPITLSKTARSLIIRMLKELKDKFQELIQRTTIDEQEIQDFLEDYRFLIDPRAKQIWSKQSLGERNQADFILGYGNSIRVVEIKRPFDRIFSSGVKFSSKTLEALSELNRYQEWIKSNDSIVKGRFGSGILEKGWGIIGRSIEMSKKELERLTSWNSASREIELKCFDSLLINFDIRIKQLSTF